MLTPPLFFSPTSLARKAGVARPVIFRLISQAVITPDGFLAVGDVMQPIFREANVDKVISNLRPAKRLSLQ